MNIGDLVEVVRDPGMLGFAAVGRVGVIERLVDGDKALVQFINSSGEMDGAAFVLTSCLEMTNDPAHIAMLAIHRHSEAEAEQKMFEWRQQRRREIEAIAQKYGMTVEQVLEITEAVIGDDAHVYY